MTRQALPPAHDQPRPAKPADPHGYPPRGLSREEAARWVGVGTTKFDELVAAGKMPRPKRVDGRTIWDRFALDAAFTDLPEDHGNGIDGILQRPRRAS